MPVVGGGSRAAFPRPAIPMRVVPWSKGPGPTGLRPRAVGTCTGVWKSSPPRSKPSAGRPRSGSVNGSASAWPQAHMPIRSSSLLPAHCVPACGPWPSKVPGHRKQKDGSRLTPNLSRFPTAIGRDAASVWCHPRQREEAARYARPSSEAGTRRRQGRWEPTHGEQRDQPSCLPGSGSSERERRKYEADVKKLLPTLDIGSHINATRQALPEAGARHERSNCLDCQGGLVYFFSFAPPGVSRTSDASAWH